MKILFVMRHTLYVRRYEAIFIELAKKGHQIHLIFTYTSKSEKSGDEQVLKLAEEYPSITYDSYWLNRKFWRFLEEQNRNCYNYLRYLGNAYEKAGKLRQRAEACVPFLLRFILEKWIIRKREHRIWWIIKWLRRIEQNIPLDPTVKKILQKQQPDLFLVTPLVEIGTRQLEWLKCAQRLGIRNILCVASWDNLTNKGLIQIEPDSIIVWNEYQRSEIAELHKISPEKVITTGAQCFDQWFTRKPLTSYAQFCQKVGLQEDKPFLLYLCSSRFIAPNEVWFVKNWILHVRKHAQENIRNMGVLIRPHFKNAEQWQQVDFADNENVVIYPKRGASPVTKETKADFFDSMFHCVAVVGLNTSAMIEAGILNKPVFTILDPQFKGAQEGTLHFHHLVKGGLLQVSSDFTQHLQQLQSLDNPEIQQQRRQFIQRFLRPHGIDKASTPIFVNVLEKAVESEPVPRPRPNFHWWTYPLKLTIAIIALLLWIFDKISIIANKIHRGTKLFMRGIRWGISLVLLLASKYYQMLYAPIAKWVKYQVDIHPSCIELRHRQLAKMEQLPAALAAKNLAALSQLKQITAGKKPIIIGPWRFGVEFELLYWIPFLHWAAEYYQLQQRRLIVVSRGNNHAWYGLKNDYIDIFSYVNPSELPEPTGEKLLSAEMTQHWQISDLDRKIIDNVRQTLKLQKFSWLHPSLMCRLFYLYWSRECPRHYINNYIRYQRLTPEPMGKLASDLPEQYAIAKFDMEINSSIQTAIRTLAEKTPVVIWSDSKNTLFKKTHELRDRMHIIDNLNTSPVDFHTQNQIISNASLFFGTYSGLSYLAPYYGIPSITFYTDENFDRFHVDSAKYAFDMLKQKYSKDDQYNPQLLVLQMKKLPFLQNMFSGCHSPV